MFAPSRASFLASPYLASALRVFCAVAVITLCAILAKPLIAPINWSLVAHAGRNLDAWQWGGSVLACIASFMALGRYDVLVHRHLGTGISTQDAQLSGASAVALSQVLGFGLLTGTIARWRALPLLSMSQAGAVTALVSISFLLAWLFLFGISGLISQHPLPLPALAFAACTFSALCLALFTLLRRYIQIKGHRVQFPSLRAIRGLVQFAFLDTLFAALALWLLLPAGIEIGFGGIYTLYLACLGGALISNTPGGIGPFELLVLFALSHHDINDIMASMLAFRLIYFALPACAAMLFLWLKRPMAMQTPSPQPELHSLHAESAVARQGGGYLYNQEQRLCAATMRSTQSLACLFEPCKQVGDARIALEIAARAQAASPILYKCAARSAIEARRAGWAVERIASDAVISLKTARLDLPARSGLRRKLRKAKKAGVDIAQVAPSEQVLRQAQRIDQDWQRLHGSARGFSMGRFESRYVAEQKIVTASRDGEMIAFITCHHSDAAWALDIMRHGTDVEDGVMHALVWHALERAQQAGCMRFSLASAPCNDAPLFRALARIGLDASKDARGLLQFKSSFAPQWHPLYAAAPSKGALYLGLWDIWQEVQDPPPLHALTQTQRSSLSL